MRLLILVLIVLSIQGTIAWDIRDWSGGWWKQDVAPVKHKHHKHYRHHHHRKQICEPVGLTTTTTTTTRIAQITPPSIPNVDEDHFPPIINGNLSSRGINCGTGLTTQAYDRFNAIFFGNFFTGRTHEIVGPLAVGGYFTGNSYGVNTLHGSDCTNLQNSFAGYGLIVGRGAAGYFYNNIRVHGAAFLPNGANRGNIQQLDRACPVYNDRGTGLMDFYVVELNALLASQQFAYLEPTLHLSSDGILRRIGTIRPAGFDIITFGTCKTCSYPSSFSSPDAIFYGTGNWKGPIGMSWPENLIINIPVVAGSTITIQGNQPSLGMNVCNTLLNIYPSDRVGAHVPGTFQLVRATSGQFGGFFLMPEGNIIDRNRGAFAGQIVANNYYWQGNGVNILDYRAAGGTCLTTEICLPVFTDDPSVDDPDNPGDTDSPEVSSSTESSSSQESSSEASSETSSDLESSSGDSSSSTENNSSSSDQESSSGASSETSSDPESSSSIEDNSSSSSQESSSTESTSSQSQSEESISSSSSSSSDAETDSSSVDSSSNNPSSASNQSSGSLSSEIDSSSTDPITSNESFSDSISSTLSESTISGSTEASSRLSSSSSDLVSESGDSSTNSGPSSTVSSNTISSAITSSSTILSSDQSDSSVPTSTYCPTETSTECHTHHHHVTTTQYQCDQGFIHDEEILACEHDNHHHHRKDYYAGDDDDNFENDVEFRLYDYNRFDEECDINHGLVNYDEDEYEYKHYKYKGKKHHDEQYNDEDEDEEEDEDEDEDDNEEGEE